MMYQKLKLENADLARKRNEAYDQVGLKVDDKIALENLPKNVQKEELVLQANSQRMQEYKIQMGIS